MPLSCSNRCKYVTAWESIGLELSGIRAQMTCSEVLRIFIENYANTRYGCVMDVPLVRWPLLLQNI